MVEKNKVKMIVGVVERAKLGTKCEEYWPSGDKSLQQSKRYKVQVIESTVNNFFENKLLKVINLTTNQEF